MGTHHPSAPALVTTLRNAGAVLDSFVAYHRAIGFARLFLYFDDPADPDLARARHMPGVTAIAHDGALRDAWRTLAGHAAHRAFVDTEVMSRQLLNAEHAMRLARAEGFDWLLSIDSDELFYSPGQSAQIHFAEMSAAGAETVAYPNYEALPEREDIADFFRAVTLFKLPRAAVEQHLAAELRRAQDTMPPLTPFFHFYSNGKSAVRLAAEGLAPAGVHRFARPSASTASLQSQRQFVLHYACCGFETFWTKYATLGRFADKWWGHKDIAAAIGTFHTEARDAVALGRAAARDFYRRRAVLSDPAQAEALLRDGLVARIQGPRNILEGTP